MTEIALTIDHVTKQFPGTEVPALKDVSLEVFKSEILGIIGHSGAGKSTLVRMMNGLETPDQGEVAIGDFIISDAREHLKREHRRDIGMIFQHFNLFSSRTVAANVGYPLKIAGWKKADRQTRVTELLQYVGLEQFTDRYPEQLSGGQKQRVGIARALAAEPKILLADEATSALDPNTTREVLALLKQINRDFGLTIIVVTHHMAIVKEICDRVAVLDAGEIVEIAQVYDFFSAPKSAVSRNFLPKFTPAQENEIVIDIHRNPDWLSIIQEYHPLAWNIMEAQIDQLQGKPYGSVRLHLQGTPADITAFQERIDRVRWA